jgi:hypothetical protein
MTSKLLLIAGAVTVLSSAAVVPTFAQGKPQTLQRLDVTTIATGYRASKIIGASVINDLDEKIGTIDDLIVARSDRVPYAIVSVGGFLGIGTKLVAVPMASLQFGEDRTILDGADKEHLKALPAFSYAK